MKVRNTHCIEMVLTSADLAKALGHEDAAVRESEVHLEAGRFASLRVVLEYVIATKGIRRRIQTSAAADPCESMS